MTKYITATVLCLLFMCFTLKLWRADLRVPLHYNGDALLHAMFIKGMIDNGWYWQNPSLGAPSGLKMYDFPGVDNSAAIVLWVISRFTNDPILVLNIFYLLTFPLITIAGLFVFRQFKFPFLVSLAGSLLYTFLPYHFMRDESHLFLSAYYFVPLAVLVLIWIASDQFHQQRLFNLRSYNFVFSLIVCVLLGSTGLYYPFFFCFLLLVAGLAASINRRTLRALAIASVFIVVTFVTLVVNLSPSLINIYRHGDAGVTQRNLAGPEIYGLKVSQLLLPVTGHRVKALRELKDNYNKDTQVTENDAATLGFVGTVGFLLLIALLLYRNRNEIEVLQDLSVLNIFAVLLGTIGGISSLFAVFVSAGIRSYNRISVFIAFFSLLALAVCLDLIYRNKIKTTQTRVVFNVALGLVLVLGILDQTTKGFVPDYPTIRAEFWNDRAFVSKVESSLPPGSMIFQLPYVPFPEHPQVNKMVDYDHLRGYLHSRTLRWSYGAMKNREGDLWQKQVAAAPLAEFLNTLAFAGFSGVYLDRNGYDNDGATEVARLGEALQTQPTVTANGRLLFFNLADYTQRLRQKYSDTEWPLQHEMSLHPILLDWTAGFSGLEGDASRTWRWCSSEGELRITNTSQRPRNVSLEMYFVSGYEQPEDLIISGLLSDHLKTTATPSLYSKTVTLPPGQSVITFRSSARRVDAPLDPRILVFRVENFTIRDLER